MCFFPFCLLFSFPFVSNRSNELELYLMETRLKTIEWKWRDSNGNFKCLYKMCLTFHFEFWQWGNEEVCRLFWKFNIHTHTQNEMKWNGKEKNNLQLSAWMWKRNKVVCWNKEMQRIEMKTLNIGNVFIVCKWMWCSATLNATWYARAKIFNKFSMTFSYVRTWIYFLFVAPPNPQYRFYSVLGHLIGWREQCRLHWIRSSGWNWKWYLNVSNIQFPITHWYEMLFPALVCRRMYDYNTLHT